MIWCARVGDNILYLHYTSHICVYQYYSPVNQTKVTLIERRIVVWRYMVNATNLPLTFSRISAISFRIFHSFISWLFKLTYLEVILLLSSLSRSCASDRTKKKLKEHEDMLLIVLFLAVLLLVTLWQIDVRLKLKSTYVAAVQLPGAYMYPLVGNLFQILFLNPEQTFRFLRTNAAFHKKSNRFWIFGVLHYNAIKAADIEVSVMRISAISEFPKFEMRIYLV